MALSIGLLLRSKICPQGLLWTTRQLPAMSNVMLHFNVEQSILKPNSILIKGNGFNFDRLRRN
ncbi:uncharacterized protein LOC120351293 isoform X3 [Nilaparvata lugens]|uniref:uncharacterized protein LOC120351293 isoform X3 n=1 Tax=Nilaparvata lugens TaxID=108931 RepID=UPI00193CB036|nr:uncharacterized protein LOC120351293 isoform X3 [Nilaparvata lugens]